MIKSMLVKEFLLVLRDRHALAALFVMPAVFILIMSLALKDAFDEHRTLIRYSVIDDDKTIHSRKLANQFAIKTAFQPASPSLLNRDDIAKALNHGTQFVISIPQGFGRQIESMEKQITPFRVDVAADVKKDILALFQTQVAFALMHIRLEALRTRLIEQIPSIAAELDVTPIEIDRLMVVHFNSMKNDERPTSVQQSVPAWIVFGMFFVIIPMSTIFIGERKQNTLMRLCAMNVSLPVLFLGKIVPYMVINQLQVWVMIAVGIFVVPLFNADPLTLGHSVTGLLIVSASLSLAAIGVALLIAVSAKSVEQATTLGGIINILLGAIGGVMVPKFIMPDFMQTLSNFSPMSWGIEGFLDIFLRGLGVRAILHEAAALTAFGITTLIIAALIQAHMMRNVN
ncbi:MAG: ABC transporter permease [Desulfobacterales bacterium]|nr:ABC transporter permease [Desulfobacterales bacterium]